MTRLGPDNYVRKIQRLLENAERGLPQFRGSEQVALGEAVGRTLAEDLVASEDSPRFTNSQMDGFALSAEQLSRGAQGPQRYAVGPQITAGTKPSAHYPQGLTNPEVVAPVMTGAPLPEDTAAVVPIEWCEPSDFGDVDDCDSPQTMVLVRQVPSAGTYVRRRGEDSAKGDVLVQAPCRVTPLIVGVAAAQGMGELAVRRRARVLLVTGGDEIVGSSSVPLNPAAIWDSNGPMLRALCEEYDIEVVGHVSLSDDVEKSKQRLDRAVVRYGVDLIVTSGGVSKGVREVIRRMLADAEQSWFGAVAQQPGGPQGYSMWRGIPVVCLPGNPISTLVSFRMFVAPLIGDVPALRRAVADADLAGLPDRDRFARGVVVDRGATRRVVEVGGAGSHLLSQAASARCLIRIPAGKGVARGDEVDVYPLMSSEIFVPSPPPEGLVVTVSTRAADGTYEDRTGPMLVKFLRSLGLDTPDAVVVPDAEIADYMVDRACHGLPRVLLTTGGTGVTPDDLTVEAVEPLITTPMPGIVHAFWQHGLKNTPLAVLSRAVAGCTNAGFAMTLPGSPGAVRDGIEVLRELLPHVLTLRERTTSSNAKKDATDSCCGHKNNEQHKASEHAQTHDHTNRR